MHQTQSTQTDSPAVHTQVSQTFDQSVEVLRATLGEQHVLVDLDSRLHWSRSTLPEGTLPRAIVRPKTTTEIQDVMRTANRFGLSVHPISTGRNWGYGDLPQTAAEYKQRYRKSYEELMRLRRRGVAGAVYTQTTDVEGEVNGLMTYDREVQKMSAEELSDLHRASKF